jgi:hypothetical protein
MRSEGGRQSPKRSVPGLSPGIYPVDSRPKEARPVTQAPARVQRKCSDRFRHLQQCIKAPFRKGGLGGFLPAGNDKRYRVICLIAPVPCNRQYLTERLDEGELRKRPYRNRHAILLICVHCRSFADTACSRLMLYLRVLHGLGVDVVIVRNLDHPVLLHVLVVVGQH